jgi:L-cystine transport system permease protein
MELNLPFMGKTFLLALGGIPVTLQLTFLTLLISIPTGFFFSLARMYRFRVMHRIVRVYVSFIRGTPVVLQILIVYSLLPSLLHGLSQRLALGLNVFDIHPLWYGVTVFSLNTTALLSEAFRSALQTVDRGQIEAAYSAGLSTLQAYRRIVIPQALVVALPNMCNITINLIKSTSLAFMMTLREITGIAKIEASYGYNYIEAYLVIFVLYIGVCGATQILFTLLERRLGIYRPAIL